MAKTIPQLTDATTVNAADELIISQGGVTKRATGAELAKGLNTINGTVNVKDFGAVGDGVADDTAAILAAKTAATGQLLYFPEGTYKVNQYIEVFGYGAGRMLLSGAKAAEMAPMLRAGAATNAEEYAHLSSGGIACGAAGQSGQGTLWKCGPNPAWTAWSPTKEGSVIEMTQNPRGAFGKGASVSGTNRITLAYGFYPPFTDLIKANDVVGFGTFVLRVNSITVVSGIITEITVKNFDGSALTFASSYDEIFRWAYGLADVKVNIAGAQVTRIGGDPFHDVGTPVGDSSIIYNGTQYALQTRNSENVVTASGLNANATNVWVLFKHRIDSLNIFRLQTLYGTGEENFAIVGNLDGSWLLSTQAAQDGKYRNLRVGLGYNANAGRDVSPVVIHPDTKVYIGNETPSSLPSGFGSLTVANSIPVAQGGTPTNTEVARMQASFAGTDYRSMTVDFRNNFQGPCLQGWSSIDRTGVISMYLQPDGGSTMINAPTTYAPPAGKNVVVGSVLFPDVDGSYTLGSSSNKWSAVWAQTGTIQTSDARDKTDVETSNLGLSFINSLRPVSYKWIEGGTSVSEAEIEVEVERPVYEQRRIQTLVYERVDGKLVQKSVEETENVPVYDEEPVYLESGQPAISANGQPITKKVQRFERVVEKRKQHAVESVEGKRIHYGLIAQEVKEALEDSGVTDFGGWVLSDINNPDSRQALRYEQLIAPLIKAVQELSERIEELEEQLQ